MKPELLLTLGLPASGKTFFSKGWQAEDPDGRIRVNYDELRIGMFGEDWVWNRKDEEAMKANAHRIVTAALRAGLSVVVDNTNLSRHVRASWQDLGRDLGAEYIEHEIDTPIGECIRRDRLRTGRARVGQAVIDGMALQYGMLDWDTACECPQQYSGDGWHHKGCPTRSHKHPIAIVDIDSTIADDNGRLRHLEPHINHEATCTASHGGSVMYRVPDGMCETCLQKPHKDWAYYFAAVANDLPILPMVKLLERLHDHLIVLVSGRPVQNGPTPVGILTEDWLLKYNIHFDRLFLKTRDFHQKSFNFKRSIVEMLPRERVAYVFDDHVECARMYKSELPKALVLQPHHGSVED